MARANIMGATENDPIARRLQGRISFLRKFGRVKDPELMQSALEALTDLADAAKDLLDSPSLNESEHHAKCLRVREAIIRVNGA